MNSKEMVEAEKQKEAQMLRVTLVVVALMGIAVVVCLNWSRMVALEIRIAELEGRFIMTASDLANGINNINSTVVELHKDKIKLIPRQPPRQEGQ